MPTIKGSSQIADGREVPNYKESLPLPIHTHRPANYAVVDMRTGQVWIADHADPSKPVAASKQDLALLRNLLNRG